MRINRHTVLLSSRERNGLPAPSARARAAPRLQEEHRQQPPPRWGAWELFAVKVLRSSGCEGQCPQFPLSVTHSFLCSPSSHFWNTASPLEVPPPHKRAKLERPSMPPSFPAPHCQLQIGACRGHLPSASAETDSCAAAAAELQHSPKEFRVESEALCALGKLVEQVFR